MRLQGRRRVLWDYVGGALWVLPTLSVVVFLLAGVALSRVEVDEGSPLAELAFQGTADDARSLLIVVSSTMITVTGLVFALTIVALQIASGQSSPRLLRNFVGAFAYSTAGLYGRDPGHRGGGVRAPAGRLGIPGPGAGQRRGAHLLHPPPCPLHPDRPEAVGLPSARSGYLQAVHPEPLVAVAAHHDLMLVLAKQVGDHVVAGTPIAWAWRRAPGADAVQVGFERTVRDAQGELRVALPRPTFHDYLRLGTAQIRRYGAAEPAMTRALIALLRDAGTSSADEDRRHACVRHIRLVLDDARRATAQPADVEAVAAEAATALRLLGGEPSPAPAA
jgi:uncharacterized membrane protein